MEMMPYGFCPEKHRVPDNGVPAQRYSPFRQPAAAPNAGNIPQQKEGPALPAKTLLEDWPGGKSRHRHIPCHGCRRLSPFGCKNVFTPGEELFAKPQQLITQTCCDTQGCAVFRSDQRSSFWPAFARPRWLSCDELYPAPPNTYAK